jgi:hypothetical protein
MAKPRKPGPKTEARQLAKAMQALMLTQLVASARLACAVPVEHSAWGYYQTRDWKDIAHRLNKSAQAKRPSATRLQVLVGELERIAKSKPMDYRPSAIDALLKKARGA